MFRTLSPYLAVFVLALAVRGQHLCHSDSELPPPGLTETERAAVSLARDGVLGNVFAEGAGPSAHLSPLYPWLLGQLYRLCDTYALPHRATQMALVTLLTCVGIALIPLLARRARLTPGAGWLAALLLCVIPGNRHFECSGTHEQPLLFVALTVLLLLLIRLRETNWRSFRWELLAAGVTGLCALLGPMFVVIVGLVLLTEFWLHEDRRAVLTGGLTIALTTLLLLWPWALRNRHQLGDWVWTRSNFGLELWIGNNANATGQTYFPHFSVLHPFSNPSEAAAHRSLGELAYMRQKERAAREWIAAHPRRFCELVGWRCAWFWFPSKAMVWWDGKTWIAWVYGASSVGALAGLLCLFRTGHPCRWLFLLTLLGFSLPYLITHVDVRYRYPLCGLCALLSCEFAVRGAHRSWRRLQGMRS